MILDLKRIRRKHKLLCKKISLHNDLYYNLGTPQISDREYDLLYQELVDFESQYHGYLDLDNSPTRTIGSPVSQTNTVRHEYPMLSLQREDQKALRGFLSLQGENGIVIEPKLDGIALSLSYRRGKLHTIATRGNGFVGENITFNRDLIDNIPTILTKPLDVVVNGELVIDKTSFASYQHDFTTSRNLVAAHIRTKHRRGRNLAKNLRFFTYMIYSDIKTLCTYEEEMIHAQSLGLDTIPSSLTITSIEQALSYYNNIRNIETNYDLDGIVCKINDASLRDRIGSTLKYAKWMMAYKFDPVSAPAKIQAINFQIGKSGNLIPVADLTPVKISQYLIKRVTLHNVGYVVQNNLAPGDVIKICLSGGIIPYVMSIITSTPDRMNLPKECPSCQNRLVLSETNVHLCCIQGWRCPEIMILRLKHFASKNAFNISGLNHKTIRILVENHMLSGPADLFRLKLTSLRNLAGFQEKKALNLIQAIHKSRQVSAASFLYSLSIDLLGIGSAQKMQAYITHKSHLSHITQDFLEQVKLGKEITRSILNFYDDKHNVEMIRDILQYCHIG